MVICWGAVYIKHCFVILGTALNEISEHKSCYKWKVFAIFVQAYWRWCWIKNKTKKKPIHVHIAYSIHKLHTHFISNLQPLCSIYRHRCLLHADRRQPVWHVLIFKSLKKLEGWKKYPAFGMLCLFATLKQPMWPKMRAKISIFFHLHCHFKKVILHIFYGQINHYHWHNFWNCSNSFSLNDYMFWKHIYQQS